MKYEKEFKKSKTRNIFVNKLLRKYSISEATAVRRYYDLRKKLNTAKEIVKPTPLPVIDTESSFLNNPEILAEKPGVFKMSLLDDIKRFAKNNIINELKVQGFTREEIKWLRGNKLI